MYAAPKLAPTEARLTTTFYSYCEYLIGKQAPRLIPLLGLRWTFGVAHSCADLGEFALPHTGPPGLLGRLEERGCLRITRHDETDEANCLIAYLETGQSAIVGIDAFYIPFRPAYQRVHSARTVLVRCCRSRRARDGLMVLDGWRPASTSMITVDELEQARFSRVPVDLEQEPLFSGQPVRGTWFALRDLPDKSLSRDPKWVSRNLGELVQEASENAESSAGRCGPGALIDFRRGLENTLASSRPETLPRRDSILALRPELTSRLYFCAFLRQAAMALEDAFLADTENAYRRSLGHLQAVVDVLTKTLRDRKTPYDKYIIEQFRFFEEAERRAISDLGWFA